MRSVGVREFRDQASSLLATSETLVIERHGEPIGFYVPVGTVDRTAGRQALTRLGEVVAEVLELTGLSEDDLVGELEGFELES